jgi:iron complex transport system substrate-binding protein
MYKLLCALIILFTLAACAEAGIPGDADGNDELSSDELADAVLSYMFEGHPELSDMRDAAHVYAYWDGEPRTIVDSLGREVAIYKPIKRIITLGNYRCEAVKVLGAADKIVGIDTTSKESSAYFADLLDKPDVGTWNEPNYEAIAGLIPDIVITSANQGRVLKLEEKLTPFGITVIGMDFYRDNLLKSEVEKLGYILEKENEAGKYIEWLEHWERRIKDYVDGLSEEEKPRVYMEWGYEPGKSFGKGSSGQFKCAMAGGRNIASEEQEYPTLESEWIIKQNPDVIVKHVSIETWGWNSTKEAENIINEIKRRPGWNNIHAVKNNRIYVFSNEIAWGMDSIVSTAYWAKWFHPALDIDPEQIYTEYLTGFMDIPYPEDRIFVYPGMG